MSDIKMLNLSLAPRTLNLALTPKKNGHREPAPVVDCWEIIQFVSLLFVLLVIGIGVLL